MNDDIMRRCFILKDMYYIESIKREIDEVLAAKKDGKLKDKQLIKNFEQIKIVGEILNVIKLDISSLIEYQSQKSLNASKNLTDKGSPIRQGSFVSNEGNYNTARRQASNRSLLSANRLKESMR